MVAGVRGAKAQSPPTTSGNERRWMPDCSIRPPHLSRHAYRRTPVADGSLAPLQFQWVDTRVRRPVEGQRWSHARLRGGSRRDQREQEGRGASASLPGGTFPGLRQRPHRIGQIVALTGLLTEQAAADAMWRTSRSSTPPVASTAARSASPTSTTRPRPAEGRRPPAPGRDQSWLAARRLLTHDGQTGVES